MIDLNLNPTARVLRQFAGAWLVVLAAFATSQWLRGNPRTAIALGACSVIVGVAGLVRPGSVRWLFVACTVAAFPIGWVVSHVMLLALFVGVMTPVAIVFRLAGRDRLSRRRPARLDSYWKPKTPPADVRRYLRQY